MATRRERAAVPRGLRARRRCRGWCRRRRRRRRRRLSLDGARWTTAAPACPTAACGGIVSSAQGIGPRERVCKSVVPFTARLRITKSCVSTQEGQARDLGRSTRRHRGGGDQAPARGACTAASQAWKTKSTAGDVLLGLIQAGASTARHLYPFKYEQLVPKTTPLDRARELGQPSGDTHRLHRRRRGLGAVWQTGVQPVRCGGGGQDSA